MLDLPTTAQPQEPLAPNGPFAFHRLNFQPDGGQVTVGRPEVGAFVVLPHDGAELLRRLMDGMTCAEAAIWYEAAYGEPVDVADFVAGIRESGFLRADNEPEPAEPTPVRWVRLGRAIFSPAGAVAYAALIAGCLAAIVCHPDLLPTYHHMFFTRYMSLLVLGVYFGQLPLILLHEAAHALAGRRLGLPSTLSVGRRLYYLVFFTTMDGLVGVPRRKRYLPILAGALTDSAVLAALTLAAAATRRPDGTFPLIGSFALALAYTTLLRLIWQCWFFAQTDLYYLIVTVLGCVDLHTTTRQVIINRWDGLRGRPARYDPRDWHPRDRAVSRWYAVLVIAGYAFSVVMLLTAMLPVVVRVFATAVARLTGHGSPGGAGLVDSLVFLLLSLGELSFAATLYFRERRIRRSATARTPS